ncbi:hypothetical protein F5146DRAFT_996539 [Armillaria mellea]|nr:hypothetical protein F5146DRAFT_996539 [Armillaria mellea]
MIRKRRDPTSRKSVFSIGTNEHYQHVTSMGISCLNIVPWCQKTELDPQASKSERNSISLEARKCKTNGTTEARHPLHHEYYSNRGLIYPEIISIRRQAPPI